MTMQEKLRVHREIEAENERKLKLWKAFEYAKKVLGFYPANEDELTMFESNGYDDVVFMYR